jgi:hypothetical protein
LGALFPAWRYHAVFTDLPLPTLEAEAAHRRHAIVDQVMQNGPIAHLPSVLCRELGAAGASPNRVQPHPRRRLSGLGASRQGPHRDHSSATAERPGSHCAIGPTPDPAVTGELALAATPGNNCSPPPPDHRSRTERSTTEPETTVKRRADRPNSHDDTRQEQQ